MQIHVGGVLFRIDAVVCHNIKIHFCGFVSDPLTLHQDLRTPCEHSANTLRTFFFTTISRFSHYRVYFGGSDNNYGGAPFVVCIIVSFYLCRSGDVYCGAILAVILDSLLEIVCSECLFCISFLSC